MDEMRGTVTRIMEKGFGFLRDDNGQPRFWHSTELMNCEFKDIREGDTFKFLPVSGAAGGRNGGGNGLRAERIYRVDAA